MTDTLDRKIDFQEEPSDDSEVFSEEACEEAIYEVQPSRLRIFARRATCAAALSATLSGVVFEIQNHDTGHIVDGLSANGDMEIPDIESCGLNRSDYFETAPPDTTPPDTGETDNTTTTTSEPKPSEDPEDEAANQAAPAARHNDALSNPIEAILQYEHYFKNEVARHTSSLSGIEYIVFVYGEDFPYGQPQLNFNALEQLEAEIYDGRHTYLSKEKQWAVDCTAEALFKKKVGEGRQIPVVIPSKPAYIRNFVVDFDIESDKPGQSGYAWPHGDVDFLWHDFNEYDEFIVLTTGRTGRSENPYISPLLTSHELRHKQVEIAEAEGYTFEFGPEEKYVKSFDFRLEHDPEFKCALPFVVYGDPDAAAEKITSECEVQ